MIRRVGVLGAGVMGAGIAAHVAGAGVPVVLLDIVPGAAARAVGAMGPVGPAPIETGDVAADFMALADCDWIVEAIFERPNAKRDLFDQLDTVRKDGSIVSSNTSTIRLGALTHGLGARLAADFLVTHFFNAPRSAPLLELVAGRATRPEAVATLREFIGGRLGKTIVTCADRPGFIVNRIGALWIASAVRHAIGLSLTVEEADAVADGPFGVPRSGVFGHLDEQGIDRIEELARSLLSALPPDDAFHAVYREEPVVVRLLAEGHTGRRAKGGFYVLAEDDAEGVERVLDLASGEYRARQPVVLESLTACAGDLRALVEYDDRGGRYARAVLLDTLSYAASLVPDIAASTDSVDTAIRLGLGWTWGPFELIARVGPAWLAAALRAAGRPVAEMLESAETVG
jgi:3-hydroxyacyl-CoA dehydrogenase